MFDLNLNLIKINHYYNQPNEQSLNLVDSIDKRSERL